MRMCVYENGKKGFFWTGVSGEKREEECVESEDVMVEGV